MKTFNLPDLGEGLPDAEITQWHVKIGDSVKTDDPLVSMETAKAVVDVPSPQDGVIAKLHGKPGDIIETGKPLVEFSPAGETADVAIPSASGPNGIKESGAKDDDSATVAGKIEVGNTVLEESATGVVPVRAAKKTLKAAPAVRALAKKLQVNLASLAPSGAQGQITADDVKQAAKAQAQTGQIRKATLPPKINLEDKTVALRGVRRAMANAMAQSHTQVVPVTLVDDADIHAWLPGTDITYRVIRALIVGCQHEPALNAHFDSQAMQRQLFGDIHIGIAMDSKDGLFVPVLKHAQKQQPGSVRKTINRFKTEVKGRSIPPDDLKGSTIQLSNFGTFAGRYANPVIVPPTVAILGTGRICAEVVAIDNAIAIHRIMPLSLTIDHRAVTGGEAARFLAAVIHDLEEVE